MLGLWHTSLYYKKKYKLNSKLNNEDIQSGGTDVTEAFNDIKKNNPDLAIILTDMYLELPELKSYKGQVIFIISENGNKNHGFTLPTNYKVINLVDLK
jgi:ABC-type branched-subunit amino acid transport system substrate-binding protein